MDSRSVDIGPSHLTRTQLMTPVLFLIFSRPETTKKVFEAIRKAKPSRLYVAADGPRDGVSGEPLRCEQARKIATSVDWECEVHTLFRQENLGCGNGPSTAITWFFEHEAEGIILEDDCVPSPSFFRFCSEMLERYRDDYRIMHIAGTNLEGSRRRNKQYSYGFSRFTYCWGWATWRRAWKFHDFDMKRYREIADKKYLEGYYNSIYESDYFEYVFAKVHNGDRRNIWDYQWQFACLINSGLVVVPVSNLVVNIGLGVLATNTLHRDGIGHHLELEELYWPLRHPEYVMVNRWEEKQMFINHLTSHSSRLKSRIKRIFPKSVIDKLKASLRYFAVEENAAKTLQREATKY